MSHLARDDILARTDLPALADDLLGARRGFGAGAKWPCPSHQAQTGRTPPVSIFTTPRGEQRWHCHACGAGGTAIDLVMATDGGNVRTALEALAARADLEPGRHVVAPPRAYVVRGPPEPSAAVGEHVARCAGLLWTERGRAVREWLHGRGFTDATLHYHQIGADPGPRHLERARGLPWRGPAAILPVHDRQGDVVYFQARYLEPERADGRKYDNPATSLANNPKLACLEAVGPARSSAVFVCEGLPDALSITQAGHRSLAVLGVGLAGPRIAERITAEYAEKPIRVAFDADPRGQEAAETLLQAFREAGHADACALTLPPGVHDTNDWLRTQPANFTAGLSLATGLDLAVEDVAISLDF